MIKVRLVKTMQLLPQWSVPAIIECVPYANENTVSHLIELEGNGILQSDDILFRILANGQAHLMLSNPSGCMCVAQKGTCIGEAVEVSDNIYPEELMIRMSTQELKGFYQNSTR